MSGAGVHWTADTAASTPTGSDSVSFCPRSHTGSHGVGATAVSCLISFLAPALSDPPVTHYRGEKRILAPLK